MVQERSFVIYNHKECIMSGITYMTKEGYDRLRAELEEMKTSGREQVAKAIAEAREKGDLSENAEYDAAKDAQGMLELKINELEKALANARVLDESMLDNSKVTVLSNVTIRNKKTGKDLTYKLVAEAEADLKSKKISVTSPIGQGLLGKSVGESAVVHTPAGQMEFEIIEISF
jgi:transcription elongation factor GreA